MPPYHPMTLATLASYLTSEANPKTRWKVVWEFLEEYRWEPRDTRATLLLDEPPLFDSQWDALLAALAEHLADEDDTTAPAWAASRILNEPWYPAELQAQRDDADATAPPAFRRHGVLLSAADLTAA